VEQLVRRVVKLITQLDAYQLQPMLKALVEKQQGSKCAMHVTVTSGDDLINRPFVLSKKRIGA
jgi:hypothetical protein